MSHCLVHQEYCVLRNQTKQLGWEGFKNELVSLTSTQYSILINIIIETPQLHFLEYKYVHTLRQTRCLTIIMFPKQEQASLE